MLRQVTVRDATKVAGAQVLAQMPGRRSGQKGAAAPWEGGPIEAEDVEAGDAVLACGLPEALQAGPRECVGALLSLDHSEIVSRRTLAARSVAVRCMSSVCFLELTRM